MVDAGSDIAVNPVGIIDNDTVVLDWMKPVASEPTLEPLPPSCESAEAADNHSGSPFPMTKAAAPVTATSVGASRERSPVRREGQGMGSLASSASGLIVSGEVGRAGTVRESSGDGSEILAERPLQRRMSVDVASQSSNASFMVG